MITFKFVASSGLTGVRGIFAPSSPPFPFSVGGLPQNEVFAPLELYIPQEQVKKEGVDALQKRIVAAVTTMVAELNTT